VTPALPFRSVQYSALTKLHTGRGSVIIRHTSSQHKASQLLLPARSFVLQPDCTKQVHYDAGVASNSVHFPLKFRENRSNCSEIKRETRTHAMGYDDLICPLLLFRGESVLKARVTI
jgi:hypothetical protein